MPDDESERGILAGLGRDGEGVGVSMLGGAGKSKEGELSGGVGKQGVGPDKQGCKPLIERLQGDEGTGRAVSAAGKARPACSEQNRATEDHEGSSGKPLGEGAAHPKDMQGDPG